MVWEVTTALLSTAIVKFQNNHVTPIYLIVGGQSRVGLENFPKHLKKRVVIIKGGILPKYVKNTKKMHENERIWGFF